MYRAHATKQKDGEICKAAPVGVGGETEKLEWACSSRRRSKMLADVGMVKMYSKSAHVIDLGFAWTGWPHSLHGPASSLFLRFFRQVVCKRDMYRNRSDTE